MRWGLNLVLVFSLVGLSTAQSPLCGTNEDAATVYNNMIDKRLPEALATYKAATSAFASSKATPEDIDDLYHASTAYYGQYLNLVISALSYVDVEVFRNCTTAPNALATLFNSTSKVRQLRTQYFSGIMSSISSFEPKILAQGTPGHWANYQPLDFLAYSSWYSTKIFIRGLAKGQPTPLENEYMEWYNTVEAVRAQFYREGYGKQPRPESA